MRHIFMISYDLLGITTFLERMQWEIIHIFVHISPCLPVMSYSRRRITFFFNRDFLMESVGFFKSVWTQIGVKSFGDDKSVLAELTPSCRFGAKASVVAIMNLALNAPMQFWVSKGWWKSYMTLILTLLTFGIFFENSYKDAK